MPENKKIFQKKLIIYIIMASVLASSIIFYVYKSKKLDSGELTKTGINIITKELNQPVINFKKYNNFNLDFFNDNKFNELKEISVKRIKAEIGRNNPFESPFVSSPISSSTDQLSGLIENLDENPLLIAE